MKKLVFAAAFLAAGGLGLHDISVGHGGTYRGPGDTVPPGGGGGGGGGGPSSGPSGPSSPGGGPSGAGPASPGRPSGGPQSGPNKPSSPRGSGGGDDLTGWQFWWGFNKEPYLNLKAAIHAGGSVTGSDDFFLGRGEKEDSKDTLRPSEEVIRQQIVPALLHALETERQNDIVTGAMMALAKIGDTKDEAGQADGGFAEVIKEFLGDGSQEIRETAAIALGILGNDQTSKAILTDVALDTSAGQKLAGNGGAIDERTRSFAIFGLGMIGYRTTDNETKREIVDTLLDILQNDGRNSAQRDMSVAALTSMGLTPLDSNPDWAPTEEQPLVGNECREAQLRWLLDYYDDELNVNFMVRAHVPTAMGRLLQFTDPRAQHKNQADQDFRELKKVVAERLLADIHKNAKGVERELAQSAVIALGQIGDCDEDEIDARIREALMDVKDNIADQQARHFALIALAQVGGRPGKGDGDPLAGVEDVRDELLKQLTRGKSTIVSWAGLALGVLERSLVDAGQPSVSADVASAVRTQLDREKAPREVGAWSIANGIMKDLEAKSVLSEKLETTSDPDTRGYCAVGLGLLGDRSVIEQIQEVVKASKYRPELLRSAAVALGLLGDKDLVEDMTDMLRNARGLSAQAAISSALGFIGDARSVDPLIEMLQNQSLTASARGFAAVALGIVADKEELPWNAKVSVNINYRANTPTLTDTQQGTGILDIL